MKQNDVIPHRGQIDIQPGGKIKKLRNGPASGHQIAEQFSSLLQEILLHLTHILFLNLLLLMLLLDLDGERIHFLQQIPAVNRFGKVLGNADFNALLGVFELLIAGENNDFNPRHLLFDEAAQGQTIHKGHLDIRNNNIRF